MPETAGKVPISEHLKNASAPSLAVDPRKNLVLGCQFPFADTERRKVWNSQENRTPNMPGYATCACADSHRLRLTSGGR